MTTGINCTVEVLSHGRTITAPYDQFLFEALAAGEILLRADCGGKGKCGKCRVHVQGGAGPAGTFIEQEACTLRVTENLAINIPEASLLSSSIVKKPPAVLPVSFTSGVSQPATGAGLGIAIDLGTTTVAICLCDLGSRQVLSSVAVKNPQALYGDDVMSRIGWIGGKREKLRRLQQLVARGIEWGVRQLLADRGAGINQLTHMVAVGNPTMIHILLGVDPAPIGIAPYRPAFPESRQTMSAGLGLKLPDIPVRTLDQISGFIGGDTLAAILATELEDEPVGTLLIDLGTNGELVLKGRNSLFAASCATGPVFEGASLSCGMQALPGAIDRVDLPGPQADPVCRVIGTDGGKEPLPSGICGSGAISAVAALVRTGVVAAGGLLQSATSSRLASQAGGGRKYVLVPADLSATGRDISLSQQDIRAVQLGKAALITGIEFLLRAAGLMEPAKIIIAGAFGSNLDAADMMALGMLPNIELSRIAVTGNGAGAGAIMLLCDDRYLDKAHRLAGKISVIELAAEADFQKSFIERLSFSRPFNPDEKGLKGKAWQSVVPSMPAM